MLIALGANVRSTKGSPAGTLTAALAALEMRGAVIRSVSPFYHTPAFPAGSGPDFVNAAAEMRADWAPDEALTHLHDVEAAMGRVRESRWGQRTLDLDLIAMGDQVLPDAETHRMWRDMALDTQMTRAPDQLILPHPRLQDRAFVLIPLCQIAADWRHPLLGKTVAEMCEALPEDLKSEVRLAR